MLNDNHRKGFLIFYLMCLLAGFLWFVYYGLTFTQLAPVYYYNKPDVTGNLLLSTGIQHGLMNSPATRFIADLLFILLPFSLLLQKYFSSKLSALLAIITSLNAIAYAYMFSIMSFVSIEVFTAWMFIPLVFAVRSPRAFYYLLHCIRIVFILIFLSTALWKIRAGGIFNIEQMSAVLFWQHASYLAAAGNGFYAGIITYLVDHPAISYMLYLVAFLMELAFLIGLFTRKFDKVLMIVFFVFIFFNYFLMEINYFTWLPFLGCLYLSRKAEPVTL